MKLGLSNKTTINNCLVTSVISVGSEAEDIIFKNMPKDKTYLVNPHRDDSFILKPRRFKYELTMHKTNKTPEGIVDLITELAESNNYSEILVFIQDSIPENFKKSLLILAEEK